MRHVHLEMIGGLAGDIFLAASIDAGLITAEELQRNLRLVGLGDVEVITDRVTRCGIASTHLSFSGWDPVHEADHRHLTEIEAMISASSLDDGTKARATAMFRDLGRAESEIHGVPMDHVHFHEVGAVDSILDFVGAALVLERAHSTWSHGPIPLGHGTIQTDHGPLPALAPATARLLHGFTLEPVDVAAELITPTGAAILRALDATELPASLTLSTDGYGAGTKDFPKRANVARLAVYDGADARAAFERDTISRLEADIDDLSPEVLAYTESLLLEAGALDVVRSPVTMKKGRTGIRISVLCETTETDRIADVLFSETSTFGLRVERIERIKLRRRIERVSTSWGPVRIKIGSWGDKLKASPEYEDCAALARAHGVPLTHVMDSARSAWSAQNDGDAS